MSTDISGSRTVSHDVYLTQIVWKVYICIALNGAIQLKRMRLIIIV